MAQIFEERSIDLTYRIKSIFVLGKKDIRHHSTLTRSGFYKMNLKISIERSDAQTT